LGGGKPARCRLLIVVVNTGGNSFKRHLDSEILERARRQHGHVARRQLLELGVGPGLIAGRLAAGAWVAVHRGVYCIGPRRNDPVARAAAAVLACGPGAVLSHEWAATLWGFLPRWSGPIEVTTTVKRAHPGITSHRCQSLEPRDLSRQRGVPITSPARTALDIAPRLSTKQLTRLVNDALRDKDLRPASLQDVLERNRYHPGTRLLRPFVDSPHNPTHSDFEDDFLAFCEKYGLPRPEINFPFNGRKLDAFFPEHGVIVECDGWSFHNTREAFEDDRERDADHLDHGLVTVRLTKPRFDQAPEREAARLHRILRRQLAARAR
jgi:hypothetical protein